MKTFIAALVLVFAFALQGRTQYSRYVIQLKNKALNTFTVSNPSQFLSARAIQRRTRYAIVVDSTDLPVTQRYIDSIKAVPNVTVLSTSKWLNQVLIRTTTGAAPLAKINSFPFVQSSSPIAVRTADGVTGNPNGNSTNPSAASRSRAGYRVAMVSMAIHLITATVTTKCISTRVSSCTTAALWAKAW